MGFLGCDNKTRRGGALDIAFCAFIMKYQFSLQLPEAPNRDVRVEEKTTINLNSCEYSATLVAMTHQHLKRIVHITRGRLKINATLCAVVIAISLDAFSAHERKLTKNANF